MTVIYGLAIAILIVLLALWGFRKIRDGNKDELAHQLCMIWERDFLSYADRNEVPMEEIVRTINIFRSEINKEIKREKRKIPLLDGESLSSDKKET